MTITLFSCIQEEKTKDLRVIDLAGSVGKTSVVNLSEIAESIDYIPLETNDESLLAPPLTNLSFVNGKLYIRQFMTEIKIFNQDGSFIKIFNKKGRGPQEYEALYDLDIDLLTSNLLVFSHKKLSEYNINGDFVRRILLYQKEEISIFGPNRYFKIEENLNLITFNNYKSKYTSCVTDSLFNVLYFISFSDKDLSTRLNSSKQIYFLDPYFYKFRDSVRIFNGYGENILSASNSKGVDTSFILNYGEYHYKNINLNVRNYNNLPFIRRYRRVYESSNYLFMEFFMGSLPHKPKIILRYEREKNEKKVELPITASLFNKKTGQFQYVDQPEINQFGFVDDFEGGPAIWPDYISEDDFMVTIIDAYKFIQHAQTHKVSDKFKKIAVGLKEDDNPVVVLVKLKSE